MDNEFMEWYKMEDRLLVNLYRNHNLNLEELSKIHKRSPESIKARLIKLKIIEETPNFIFNQLEELFVNNRTTNKFMLLSEVLSKHFRNTYKRISLLEKELNDLKEFKSLSDID